MTFTLPTSGSNPFIASKTGLEDAIDSAIAAVAALGATGWPYHATVAAGVAAVNEGDGYITSSQSAILFYRKTSGVGELLAQVGVALAEARLAALEAIGATGMSPKTPAACATTGNITLSGEQTIDGVATTGSRVLVKNQTTASQNGIYVSGSGAWTRASDMDAAGEFAKASVYVTGGTINAGRTYYQTNTVTTVGTDAVSWLLAQDASGVVAQLNALEGYKHRQGTFVDKENDERFAYTDIAAIAATNITDAATPSYTPTKTADGLQIALSTGSRNIVFSTVNRLGANRTRVKYKGVISTGTTGCAGLSVFDGVNRSFFQFQGNIGRLTVGGASPAGVVLDGAGPLAALLTVEMEFIFDAATKTATMFLSLNGGAPYSLSFTGVAIGNIELFQRNAATVTHSLKVSALGEFEKDTIDVAGRAEVSQTNRNSLNAALGLLETFRRKTPSGWTYAIPNGYRFHQNAGQYFSSIDLRPPLSEADPDVLVLHVDIATGSDSNPGTAALPLKSLHVAASRSGAGGKTIIKAKGGLYPYANCYRNIIGGGVVQLVSWDGNPVVSSMHDATLSWSLNSGTTYQASLSSGGVSTVFDAANLTADGDYGALNLAASLADCQSTPGSYFVSGSTIYVNTYNGRAPDASLRVYTRLKAGAGDLYGVRQTTDGQILYMEDLHLEGGDEPFSTRTAINTQTITTYAKRCTVKYGAANGVNQNSAGLQVWQDCVAAWNGDDGFNWKSSPFGGAGPLAIEIRCIGRWNGRDSEGTNNGSTMHSAGSVIRVGGSYPNNQDRCVHDIDRCFSWNMGCTAGPSQTGDAAFACGTVGATDDPSKMWLDGCTALGGVEDIRAGANNSTVYRSGFTGTGTQVGAGTITTYTP